MKSQSCRPAIIICFLPLLICLMVLSISGKETLTVSNNLIYLFGMYEPDSDSITIYANDGKPFIINCQKCNPSLSRDDKRLQKHRRKKDTNS